MNKFNKVKLKIKFIEKANKKHGNKYDYSLVEYVDRATKVKIICLKHGIFEQRINDHLRTGGCDKCGLEKQGMSKEAFIEKANKIHNSFYDYSLVEYKNRETLIKIICPKHGIFEQKPFHHLNGSKCSYCSGKKISTFDFIERAKKIHGQYYDYSLSICNNIQEYVQIICPKHGIFEQKANIHLNMAVGCKKCTRYSSKKENEWLDSLGLPNDKEHRQKTIRVSTKKYFKVDGYEPNTNTVYEFLGDFWHGNIQYFSEDKLNKANKKTMRELYNITMNKIKLLEDNGYKVIYIWERDWINQSKIK